MSLRVLLVEDERGTREGLSALLRQSAARVSCCDAVESGRAALAQAARQRYDVALVDLGLPDMAGADVVRALLRPPLAVPSLVLTVFDDRQSLSAVIAAGARGYLLKDEDSERVLLALEEVAAGGAPLSARMAPELFAVVRQNPPEPTIRLPPREEELLRLLARGCTYAECGRLLGLRVGTVQGYVKTLYRRLDVETKAEASALAVRLGIVDGS